MKRYVWENRDVCCPKVSLHDCSFNKVVIADNRLSLFLDDEISNLPDMPAEILSEVREERPVISVNSCDANDITCYIVHRYAPLHRPLRVSIGVDILSIQKKMLKGVKLELIDEFYTDNQIYWRFCLKPYKKHGLSDELEIKIAQFETVEYIICI